MDKQYPVDTNYQLKNYWPKVRRSWPREKNDLSWRFVVFIGFAVLTGVNIVGCKPGIKLIPATGLVTLDGKPLTEAAVTFDPTDGRPIASGVTDAKGRFVLSTLNRPGAVLGEHTIIISKQITRCDSMGNILSIDFLTPKRYARADTSGIKKTVSEDNNDFVIDISSKP